MSLNTGILLLLAVLLLLAIFCGLFVIFHKVRRIHLMAFAIKEQAAGANKEATALFGQLRTAAWLENQLGLDGPPLPMRQAAASPDFLLLIFNEIVTQKKSVVLDLGSGSSTVVAARCMQKNGNGHVFSLDHDLHYAALTRHLLDVHGLSDWATVIDAPLVGKAENGGWYSLADLPPAAHDIDLLVVDGPPGYRIPLARYPALPMLSERLARSCTILVDDADRAGERLILERWREEFPEFVQERIPCEKGAVRLRRLT